MGGLAQRSHMPGLSNEISFISKFSVDPEKFDKKPSKKGVIIRQTLCISYQARHSGYINKIDTFPTFF